jgi:hypothetical protein
MIWMASVLQVLALGAADPLPPLAASSAPAPIYWRQTVFSIPFHVDRPARPAEEASDVQLYVSGDRGRRWDNWLHTAPQKGHFLFRAGADGEYWFDVRTLDRSGQVHPQGPYAPKLIVIVDTVSPKVQLAAARGDDGQVTANFRIEELYPNLNTLAIDYRLGPAATWQSVLVSPKDVRSHDAEHTGAVTWYPLNQTAAATMEVRLRVSDMAGNPAESHTNISLAARANAIRPPLGSGAATGQSMANPPAAAVVAQRADPLGPPTSRTPWPAENANSVPSGPARPALSGNDVGSVAIRDNPNATNKFVGDVEPAGHAGPENPFHAFQARPLAPGANNPPPGEVGPPPGVKLRWIHTPDFQLTYDPRAMGITGSVPVELWGTRDGGRTWQSFGKDPKGQSPMLVTTSEDGIYGFRMVIQSGPEMGRPPLPGEVPGIWIGIDKTCPVGRILTARQGAGRESDKLFITWEASDNRELAARPISLSFSERQGGPWTPLAAQLENSGQYTWPLTGNLPPRIYLRLEIQDAAGNLGIYEAPEPVSLDLSTPAAPVSGMNPVGRYNAPPANPAYLR